MLRVVAMLLNEAVAETDAIVLTVETRDEVVDELTLEEEEELEEDEELFHIVRVT